MIAETEEEMRRLHVLLIGLTVLAFAFTPMAQAQTNRFVWKDNPNPPVSPFTNWADAATNIQDAISACSSGDVVWVTNGTYDTPAGSQIGPLARF